MQPDAKTGMADETVRAPVPRFPTSDLRGRRRGFPRHTFGDRVVRAVAKPPSETPRGMVEEALQASGGRRRRPSRAFFAPYATGHGHPGASLDALLLPLASGGAPLRGRMHL
jgi:hypothetical protein